MKEKFVAFLKLEGLMFAMGAAAIAGTFATGRALEWLFDDAIPKMKDRAKERKEAKKASKYVTKTIESD